MTRVSFAIAAAALMLPARPLLGQEPGLPRIPAAECRMPEDPRIEVLLVGSYHMANPGADMYNLESDDVLSEKRQAEIAALVDRLATFRPTKVAVEAPWQDSLTMVRWREYVAGTRELRRSEEEQIGFRLAHQAGLERIHPIDVRGSFDPGTLGSVIQAEPRFGRRMQELDSLGRAAVGMMAEWLANGTVGDMLYNMNRPEAIAFAHVPYIGYMVPLVADTNYAGADLVADWYRRNLRIFANITRIAEAGDRVFVIYGQGHVKTLRDFVIQHPDYCIVDPLPFLQ